MQAFSGAIFHALPPLAAHICPLLLPQGTPGAGRGAIPLPPVREKGSAAHRARPGFRDTLHGQRPFQHRIKGQHRRTKVAAIRPRPAFPQHIALAVQRQAAIVFIVVGAPFVTSLRIAVFSCRVSSRLMFAPCLGLELFPVAEHTADPAPVGAAVAAGAFGRQVGRNALEVAFSFIKSS